MKVLLVDDEPLILAALRRMLGRVRPGWAVRTAEGGREALTQLETDPPDLVLADLDMPDLDGHTLLEQVRDRWPATVRIVLSGTGDPGTRLRTAAVAHHFLAKPCELEDLLAVLDEARPLALRREEPVASAILSTAALPSAPPIYAALSRAMAGDPSLQDIERIVEQDQAIAARVLQVVNSAFFGAPTPVTSLSRALSFLGLKALRTLVLSAEAFRAFEGARRCPAFSMDDHRVHGLLTARIASRLAPSRERDTAFTGGLLHDVGTLLLADRLPERLAPLLERTLASGHPLHLLEEEALGTTHAGVGAQLLRLWGIPDAVVEVVERHHEPGSFCREWGVGGAVRAADVLARRFTLGAGLEIRPRGPEPLLDPALERLLDDAVGLESAGVIAEEEGQRAVLDRANAA